jgi:hypothetical protein
MAACMKTQSNGMEAWIRTVLSWNQFAAECCRAEELPGPGQDVQAADDAPLVSVPT